MMSFFVRSIQRVATARRMAPATGSSSSTTCRAAVIPAYGDVAQQVRLTEVPVPAITDPTQVLVRVHAASLNPIDYKRGEGALKSVMPDTFPMRLGYDLSGVVAQVGAGVADFRPGDAVVARVSQAAVGTLAEWVVCGSDVVSRKPPGVRHEEAAGLPLAGLTAYQVLRRAMASGLPTEGARVLVPAGAGGVGHLAVQLAKQLCRAHVTATVSAAKAELVRSLGADRTIDYRTEDYAQLLATQPVDLVVDTTGDTRRHLAVVKRGGMLYTIASLPTGAELARRGMPASWATRTLLDALSLPVTLRAWYSAIDYQYVWMQPSGVDLAALCGMVERGALRVLVDRVFPFTDAGVRDAFAHLKAGHATGKVVVSMIPT